MAAVGLADRCGAGWLGDTVGDIGPADTNLAGGSGFRYMSVEDQKLPIGIDAAYADEDTKLSIYCQVGDWLAN